MLKTINLLKSSIYFFVYSWQISVIQNRLSQWCEDVKQMERLLEVRAHDILT